MYKHHETSIINLLNYYKDNVEVAAILLGGSIARGCERMDSDIDAVVVISEEFYKKLEGEHRLTECIFEYCTYEKGYFDIKYCTKDFLKHAAKYGSEPTRNSFTGVRALYLKDLEIEEIARSIPIFQKREQAEKLLSFYSAFTLAYAYYWEEARDNPYLKVRAAADIALFGFRLLLEENEILFPCQKGLMAAVRKLPVGADILIDKSNEFLTKLDNDTKEELVKVVLQYSNYEPPKDFNQVNTRHVDDNELWWYKNRPNLVEW